MRTFLAFLLVLPLAAASHDWEEVSRSAENQLVLYRKEVPGSEVLAYKASAQLEAPLAKVLSVVRDTARLPEWSYRVKHAEIVENYSTNERLIYVQASPPWPVKDRDLLYRSKFIYDTSAGQIRMCVESVEDPRRPETNERVRAHVHPSCFTFIPLEGGRLTKVEAEVHGDPKGSIPKWVVNAMQKRTPEHSLRNLKARANTPGIVDDPETRAFLEKLKPR